MKLFWMWVLLASLPFSLRADELTLEAFLQQVKSDGPDYARVLANQKINEMYRINLGRHWYGNLGLAGQLNGFNGYSWGYDYSLGAYTSFATYTEYSAGLSGNAYFSNTWDFGLQTSLSYNFGLSRSWYESDPFYYDTPSSGSSDSLYLNASIPLWRNFMGEETRAQDQASFKGYDARVDSYAFQLPSVLYSAKLDYFSLARARAEVDIRTQAVAQYRALLDGAGRALGPLDKTQLRTALERAELDLESARDRERSTRNEFNRIRGKTGSEVEGTQGPEDLSASTTEAWPSEEPRRLDLLSNELVLESSRLYLRASEEQTKLGVSLNGSLSGSVFTSYYGYWPAPPPVSPPWIRNFSVGLSVNVPFDLFTDFWGLNLRTQRLSLSQQERDLAQIEDSAHRQWDDMTQRFRDSGERLDKAKDLEAGCKEKLEQGEAQFKKGRTDAFEMVGFVDQYLSARLGRLYWLDQRLGLLAQAEWYQTTKGEGKASEGPKP